MVLYDPQEFGGLEEYVTTLAIGLQQKGHPTSILSATWVPPDNQYYRRLRENKVPIVQAPRWISYPASNWETKEKILRAVLWILTPLIFFLAGMLYLQRRGSWQGALTSAHGWLRGQLQGHFIGPDRRKPLTRFLLTWWRLRWHPDLLHIQGYVETLLFVIEWAHAHRIPVVYEEHQTPDPQFDWWKDFHKFINKATAVVAVSEKSAQALRSVGGVTQPIVVRSPLLPDPIKPSWRDELRQSRNQDTINVTTISRLYVTKGLNYLLQAMVHIIQKHPATQFRVYGDGELRQELLDYAEELGLDGEAIFAGAFTRRNELSQIMSQTDIFVLPSILEGQPLGLVEAMAYGCPIVAASVGGIPELIQDGVNGLLCPPHDSTGLAERINILIENPDLRHRLGCEARRSYERGPFQPADVCNHFISIYTNVLNQSTVLQPHESVG